MSRGNVERCGLSVLHAKRDSRPFAYYGQCRALTNFSRSITPGYLKHACSKLTMPQGLMENTSKLVKCTGSS